MLIEKRFIEPRYDFIYESIKILILFFRQLCFHMDNNNN